MLPTLIPPCTLDPGGSCRDDETLVVFTLSQTINTKAKPKLYPPNPIAVIPAGNDETFVFSTLLRSINTKPQSQTLPTKPYSRHPGRECRDPVAMDGKS